MDIVSFELRYMLDDDKKLFMTTTLNFDIVVNKSYLQNYSEKYSMIDIMSQKIKNNQIKYTEILFYMMKINNK